MTPISDIWVMTVLVGVEIWPSCSMSLGPKITQETHSLFICNKVQPYYFLFILPVHHRLSLFTQWEPHPIPFLAFIGEIGVLLSCWTNCKADIAAVDTLKQV